VADGFVTLAGTANWQFQRDEAEFVASNVLGVISVTDEVPLRAATRRALDQEGDGAKRQLGEASPSRRERNGHAARNVSSWADHDEAVDAAWAAPGVTRVKDHILVAY
jgi:osmotically-inducible protein OsmY